MALGAEPAVSSTEDGGAVQHELESRDNGRTPGDRRGRAHKQDRDNIRAVADRNTGAERIRARTLHRERHIGLASGNHLDPDIRIGLGQHDDGPGARTSENGLGNAGLELHPPPRTIGRVRTKCIRPVDLRNRSGDPVSGRRKKARKRLERELEIGNEKTAFAKSPTADDPGGFHAPSRIAQGTVRRTQPPKVAGNGRGVDFREQFKHPTLVRQLRTPARSESGNHATARIEIREALVEGAQQYRADTVKRGLSKVGRAQTALGRRRAGSDNTTGRRTSHGRPPQPS